MTTQPRPTMTLAEQRAQRIERLRKTMALKRSCGQVTGRLPLGFTVKRVNGVSVAKVDPFTMKLLAEAKQMHEWGDSIRTIRRYVTQRGITGRSGKPVSISGLWKLLQNLKSPPASEVFRNQAKIEAG